MRNQLRGRKGLVSGMGGCHLCTFPFLLWQNSSRLNFAFESRIDFEFSAYFVGG